MRFLFRIQSASGFNRFRVDGYRAAYLTESMSDFQHHICRPFSGVNTQAAETSKAEFPQQKWAATQVAAIPELHKRFKTSSIKPAGRSRVRQLRHRGYSYD
jgi:hypothetical protein